MASDNDNPSDGRWTVIKNRKKKTVEKLVSAIVVACWWRYCQSFVERRYRSLFLFFFTLSLTHSNWMTFLLVTSRIVTLANHREWIVIFNQMFDQKETRKLARARAKKIKPQVETIKAASMRVAVSLSHVLLFTCTNSMCVVCGMRLWRYCTNRHN